MLSQNNGFEVGWSGAVVLGEKGCRAGLQSDRIWRILRLRKPSLERLMPLREFNLGIAD